MIKKGITRVIIKVMNSWSSIFFQRYQGNFWESELKSRGRLVNIQCY
ncbi:hypothetical protein O209_10440 [Lactiplantibacillus plantarum WHE 92]|nr:hypothetical protein O209_10440 [Lactiplantibacillus plantarum WHE 92]